MNNYEIQCLLSDIKVALESFKTEMLIGQNKGIQALA